MIGNPNSYWKMTAFVTLNSIEHMSRQ